MSSYLLRGEPGMLTVVVPSNRNWFELCACSIVPALFSYIFSGVAIDRLRHMPQEPWEWELSVIAFGSLAALAVMLKRWIWALFGKQVVTIDNVSLVLRHEIFGLGWTKEFTWNAVRAFRVALLGGVGAEIQKSRRKAKLVFDYGARTYSFAAGLDEASARELLATIERRFPPEGTGGAA